MATKKEKETIEATKIVLREAAELATVIHKHMAARPQCHPYGMTIVGYAVEMMLSNASEQTGEDYDTLSRDWRDFMVHAHDDMKRFTRISNSGTKGS